MTLLLLRNSLIPLHQSLNFIQLPSNYPGSGTMFFGILACLFLLTVTASASIVEISSVVVHLYSLRASSMIYKDSSHSDNASISFVLLELILVPLCSLYYMCFVSNR